MDYLLKYVGLAGFCLSLFNLILGFVQRRIHFRVCDCVLAYLDESNFIVEATISNLSHGPLSLLGISIEGVSAINSSASLRAGDRRIISDLPVVIGQGSAQRIVLLMRHPDKTELPPRLASAQAEHPAAACEAPCIHSLELQAEFCTHCRTVRKRVSVSVISDQEWYRKFV